MWDRLTILANNTNFPCDPAVPLTRRRALWRPVQGAELSVGRSMGSRGGELAKTRFDLLRVDLFNQVAEIRKTTAAASA